MSLPWIKVYGDLPDHPKSDRLAALTGEPRAWSHVVELWLWASKARADGNLADMGDVLIAKRAGWPGKPSLFVDGLRRAGFLDDDGHLHDWQSEQGAHADRLRKDRERKRRRSGSDDGGDSGGGSAGSSGGGSTETTRQGAEDPADTPSEMPLRALRSEILDRDLPPTPSGTPQPGAPLAAPEGGREEPQGKAGKNPESQGNSPAGPAPTPPNPAKSQDNTYPQNMPEARPGASPVDGLPAWLAAWAEAFGKPAPRATKALASAYVEARERWSEGDLLGAIEARRSDPVTAQRAPGWLLSPGVLEVSIAPEREPTRPHAPPIAEVDLPPPLTPDEQAEGLAKVRALRASLGGSRG